MTGNETERLMQRYLDGELPLDAAAEFDRRLLAEPDLREQLEAAKALQAGFVTARDAVMSPSAGFTAKVVGAVRTLPTRQQLEQADLTAFALRTCQRLLLAAAVFAALGLAWHAGLFGDGRQETLQAAPDDVQREIDRLDAIILGETGAPADPGSPRRGN